MELDRRVQPAEEAVAGELDLEREPRARLRAVGENRVAVVPVQPCAATPSSQSVASLPESQRRSTLRPAHASGTVAAARSQ